MKLRYSKIKKKNLWIWALAAFSMAACTSEDVPTQEEQVVTENDFESPDGRVVVQLGAESTPAAIVSRTEGPVEGENIIALTDLGIFAVDRKSSITDSDLTSWPKIIDKCLLMNVKAEGAKSSSDAFDPDNFEDKTVNPLDPDVNKGKKVTLYDTEASGNGAVYYYPMQSKQEYDFYGYHPRVDINKINTSSGKVTITNTLDGNIDLITGAAKKATKVLENEIYVTEHSGSTPPKLGTVDTPIEGYNAKYIRKIKYSNWMIDKWIGILSDEDEKVEWKAKKKPFVPMISFEHRLTKLNFQIITAQEQTGGGNQNEATETGGDRTEATKLRVNNVKLLNVFKDVTMTLDRDAANNNEPKVSLAFSNKGELKMRLSYRF